MPVNLHGRYATVDEAAEKLKVTPVYVRALLSQDRIVGAERIGHAWLIPLPVRVLECPSDNPGIPSKLKMQKPA